MSLTNLDLQAHLFLLTLDDKLYRAPIGEQIHNCLDVGTGTGIWAIDFGMFVTI
jgi:ubiquinone/menaquinone biosynthesis C-methylase UbiE